ncbi:hypothetical protein SODALDRAFT_339777 [Sodiomyces alkalinus F11]|uniref:Uncharacterized protein n=1 Tax=Sodiomyces alkalinus (strain CBS 110278 / VKM F-3762 / F11) TaxID=1314773 RepID=A0A3N2PY58_SODAK|nr:hypothetical protein SODALDRAFT_339777 [Sodiomyces alkalinus F11]ROT39451.1 hypothetical protein SODALDRAFT_339777 [Sodiomyces alkalinus F11]
MSSSAPAESSTPKEKKGLGKLLSRAKTILKKADGSKRMSALPSTSTPGTDIIRKTKPGAPAEQTAAAAAPEAPQTSKYEDMEGVSRIERKQLFEERARRLGEKYGLEITQSEWYSTDGTALRVDKPIRMRVRRACAACNANWASAKQCPACGSTKCKRYPPKRTEAEKIASRERRAALLKANKENAPIMPDYDPDSNDPVLKRPSKTGGQDLVHKKPRQRIRRTCHECGALFSSGSKQCSQCNHNRCTDCPRDPPKKDKYPFGYPGDEFGPNAIPHHECHECKTIFPGGAPDDTPCKKCEHGKCSECPRLQPRKVEPEPDPDVLKSVQAKIESLKLGEPTG